MPGKNEFVDHLMELLEPFGEVTVRRMFGGYGVYRQGLMFGIVSDNTLYLKADDHNRAAFEANGLAMFGYTKQGKRIKVSYYEAPAEVLEDPQEMQHWAQLGFEAALRAAHKKPRK